MPSAARGSDPVLILAAAHDPQSHVLPHALFPLLPFNFNFGVDKIPLLGFDFGTRQFYFTNHLLMTLVAAVLCLLIFPWVARAYARSARNTQAPRGLLNFFEAQLQFIRKEVALPVLKHRTDQFMPFLWTLFFFILFCNLLGMVPLDSIIYLLSGRTVEHVGGTATGNLAVTGGLAICAFFMIHVGGIREVYGKLIAGTYGHHHDEEAGEAAEGAVHRPERAWAGVSPGQAAVLAFPLYVWNFAPHVFMKHEERRTPSIPLRVMMAVVFSILIGIELGALFGLIAGTGGRTVGAACGIVFGIVGAIGGGGLHWTDIVDVILWAFLWVLEAVGAIIKPFALMMRLFANMTAGHIVLVSILALTFTAKTIAMGYTVGVITTLGCVLLSFLEIFVAGLQAYIFVFLTTLFIGLAVEPAH
jgi:F0F1-type ATP synthase membrane subunit a